ncbi:MAG: BON domain-containing protein [Acetobacteraceae bacterium]|nr:BON domain-containing protein [Acetobacteraceae bacterium]
MINVRILHLAAALALATTLGACTAATRTAETTGEYVDDAAVTAKVKAAILAEPGLRTFEIGVETFRNSVQLSGFVGSEGVKARAGQVAGAVPGVRSVRNNLIVK